MNQPVRQTGQSRDSKRRFGGGWRPASQFAVSTSLPLGPLRDLIICGPAPAPLLRAETFYRYQMMLRTRQMSDLSRRLARLTTTLTLPEDVTLTVDIDPVDLA